MSNNVDTIKNIKEVELELSKLENNSDWKSSNIEYIKSLNSWLNIQDTKVCCNIIDDELKNWVAEKWGGFMKVLELRKNIYSV